MPKTYWSDNSTYFLTGSTILHYPHFNTHNKKLILLNQINKIKERLSVSRVFYSIAINHYHLKFNLEDSEDLGRIKQYLHGGTTFEYKKQYPIMRYKEIWQPCKTFRVWSEEADWKITGYIIGNLLKHKEVGKLDELKGNPFISYDDFVKEYDEEIANNLIRSIIDINEDVGNNIMLEGFKIL